MDKILAYDLGTGGNKAALFDTQGKCLATAFVAYDTYYPKSQFHEQSPDDWWNAVKQSTRELLAQTQTRGEEIVAIAVSGHSLGVVPIDSQGNLLQKTVPIWSDSRAGEEVAEFFRIIDYNSWYRATGCGFPASHYPIFKIKWLKKNEPELFAQIDKIIGTKDYINLKLTGEVATDHSYASGSGAYLLLKRQYNDVFTMIAKTPLNLFPKILDSTDAVGTVLPEVAAELGLSPKTLVMAGGVDNSCMAAGACAFKPGRCYASLGSSSWIAVSDSQPILDVATKPYVFTHVVKGQFASALGIFSTGTTLRWVRDTLCPQLVSEAAQSGENVYSLMMRLATQSPIGSNQLMMNPALAGGSSFDPSPALRGAFWGLDLSHTQADIIRATLEGIALNLRLLLDSFRQMTAIDQKMLVVGGGAISPFWRQIYADAMRISIEKTNIDQNAAALGAAAVAAVGAGIWDDFSPIDVAHSIEAVQNPDENNAVLYDRQVEQFEKVRQFLGVVRD